MNQTNTTMKYLITLLVAFLLCFGLPYTTNADGIDVGVPEIKGIDIENCTLRVKESTFWSFRSIEKIISGPCNELVDLL